MISWITKKRCQNEKLLENIKKYEEKRRQKAVKLKKNESEVVGVLDTAQNK